MLPTLLHLLVKLSKLFQSTFGLVMTFVFVGKAPNSGFRSNIADNPARFGDVLAGPLDSLKFSPRKNNIYTGIGLLQRKPHKLN